MRPFRYVPASDPTAAARAVAANPHAKFLAGGTNILDLMKEDIERPSELVDLTRLASRELQRPVKLVYTRTQMFTGHGHRPYTIQRVALGADRSGKLATMIHEVVHNTSTFEEFSDDTTRFTRQVYACPNLAATLKITDTDLNTPTWMRAPGAVSGMFALECAMDELAYALEIDPLELRLINYAETDPESGLPFSSKALRECYRIGAEKFGWKDR
ncbi:MAG: molybdopterin cofactor-binding domain-containing protein [Candidatus Rokuibacteriota bacterium]